MHCKRGATSPSRAREGGSWLGLVLLLGVALVPGGAHAQQLRVPTRVTVEPLFGDGTLLTEGWVPVVVTVENLTRSDFAGEVHLDVRAYDGSGMRHVAPMDLPAEATRRVVLDVFCAASGTTLRARYLVDEDAIGTGVASSDYAGGGRSVVVLGDPPRLRGALLDLDVYETNPSGARQIRVPVGTVRFDAATGDPMMPEDATGWSTVKVLVVHAPVLERASEVQRAAIGDWLRGGGRLLVFPRTEADYTRPWLEAWTGPLGTATSTDVELPADLVPRGATRFGLVCGEAQRRESFGCSAPVGFGRVFVASYDGTTPAAIESGAPRELVRSIYGAELPVTPALTFGRGRDELAQRYWSPEPSFGALRAALDPNEGFRPALGLVALVLLLYVVLVGPLNFGWVQRKNRPTLALITTPVAAVGCLVVMLLVGYVGKGVTMRYRRVELVEAVEGQTRGLGRRYTGLFSTRPGSYDVPGPGDDAVAWRVGSGGADGPVHRHGGAGVTLADIRAGLWETVFLREDRMVELGGAVRFERDGRRLASVRNDSDRRLLGAIVIDTSGSIFPVGDVPAHGRAPIPRAADGDVSRQRAFAGATAEARELAVRVGLSSDDAELVRGLMHLCGAFVPVEAPVLYARLPVEPRTVADRFAPESDHRWIRIAPALRGSPVLAAAPPQTDPMGYGRTPPPPVPPPSGGAAPDAATPGADADAAGPDAGVTP